jgi:hypothetical protein
MAEIGLKRSIIILFIIVIFGFSLRYFGIPFRGLESLRQLYTFLVTFIGLLNIKLSFFSIL